MKKRIALLLCIVLCSVGAAALAEDGPTCWITKLCTPYGNSYEEVTQNLGIPFWHQGNVERIAAWETDQGTLIAQFRNDVALRWLHIAPDRTILAGNVTADDTLDSLRNAMKASVQSDFDRDWRMVDVGNNGYTPSAITADGKVITLFLGREWEAYDCVKQNNAGLMTVLRLYLGW